MPFFTRCHYESNLYAPDLTGRIADIIVLFEMIRNRLASRLTWRVDNTDLSYTASTSPIISGVTEKKSQA